MTKKRNTILLMTCICAVLMASVPNASAVTWGDDVSEGLSFDYRMSLSFSLAFKDFPLLKFISLSYSAQYTITVDTITPDNITYSISEPTGVLAEIFPMENDTFIFPNEMIIIPEEMLALNNLTIGNITVPFTNMTEMNVEKFWSGIVVKKADVSDAFGSFMIEGLPIDLDSFELYVKYDAMNGWLYQIRGFGSGTIFSFYGEASLDLSMVNASQAVKDAMEENRDHSVDVLLALSVLGQPWMVVFLTVIAIVVFSVVVFYMRKRQSAMGAPAKGKKISAASKTKETNASQANVPSKASTVSKKYREGYKGKKAPVKAD